MHLQWAAIFALLLALVLLLRRVSQARALRQLEALMPVLSRELTVRLGRRCGGYYFCSLASPSLQHLERVARWHRVRLYIEAPGRYAICDPLRFWARSNDWSPRDYFRDFSWGILYYREPWKGATAGFSEGPDYRLEFVIPATPSFEENLAEYGITGMRWSLEALGQHFKLKPRPPGQTAASPCDTMAEQTGDPGQQGQVHLSLTAAPACA